MLEVVIAMAISPMLNAFISVSEPDSDSSGVSHYEQWIGYKDNYAHDIIGKVVRLRVANELNWESTMDELRIYELILLMDVAKGLCKWNPFRLYVYELLLQHENIFGPTSDEFWKDCEEFSQDYQLFRVAVDSPTKWSHMPSNSGYHEMLAIRNYLLSTADSEAQSIEKVGELFLRRREFVNLDIEIRYLAIMNPAFSREVCKYVYSANIDYIPEYPYNSDFSLVVGLALSGGAEIDLKKLVDRVSFRKMEDVLSEDYYWDAYEILEHQNE